MDPCIGQWPWLEKAEICETDSIIKEGSIDPSCAGLSTCALEGQTLRMSLRCGSDKRKVKLGETEKIVAARYHSREPGRSQEGA